MKIKNEEGMTIQEGLIKLGITKMIPFYSRYSLNSPAILNTVFLSDKSFL